MIILLFVTTTDFSISPKMFALLFDCCLKLIFLHFSRSPMSNRRRHVGSRDAPESSNCVGVFGLSLYTTERELEKEFSKFGPLEKVTVVLDGKVFLHSHIF